MPSPKVILNLVDQVSPVNFGIWHAAIATAESLHRKHGIESWLIAPKSDYHFPAHDFPFIRFQAIEDLTKGSAFVFFSGFDSKTTVVATHGCWQFPTKWGAFAKSLGFNWIYTPHGMLEPWSMSQKWLKKKVYFELFEKRLGRKADLVRAVGKPEQLNLKADFDRTLLIPNGIYESDLLVSESDRRQIQILYLARLHQKKGVMPMVEGWKGSKLWKNPKYILMIAGTDDGEQGKLEQFIHDNSDGNIRFVGAAFGEEKRKLLQSSRFYILPSVSEGFPTSVLEAMAAGLVPIITDGCNFPEAFENQIAIQTTQSIVELQSTFDQLPAISESEISVLSKRAQTFVMANFMWDKIADQQAKAYFN